MNKKLLAGIGVSLIITVVVFFIYALDKRDTLHEIPSVLIGKSAADFKITTFSGEEISLSQYKGKPVLLNFFASWCVGCGQEARILEAAHRTYTPKGGVFIGIAINDTREAALGFIRKYGKTYILAQDHIGGDIALEYGVAAIPETFLIDKNGIIQHRQVGAIEYETIARFMESELGK